MGEYIKKFEKTGDALTIISEMEDVIEKSKETKICTWTEYDDGFGNEPFKATCGLMWILDGDPSEHAMKFCPGCGGELKYVPEESADEQE